MLKSARLGKTPRATVTPADPLMPFTSIGSYTIVYLDKRNNSLCADCATHARVAGEKVIASTYDEGPDLDCDECGEVMKASYGDPDEDGPGLTEADHDRMQEERGES